MKHVISYGLVLLLLGACSKVNPELKSLSSKVPAPTNAAGSVEWNKDIAYLNNAVDISGACDVRSSGIEVSFDAGGNWSDARELTGSDVDCSDKVFSLKLNDLSTRFGFVMGQPAAKSFLARVTSKIGPSASCKVTLNYTASGPLALVAGISTYNNATNLNMLPIVISGENVTAYKFKIISPPNPSLCAVTTGYSSETAVAVAPSGAVGDGTPATDGSYGLCVIAKDIFGAWQKEASASMPAWNRDIVPPDVDIAPDAGQPDPTNLAIKWTATFDEPVEVASFASADLSNSAGAPVAPVTAWFIDPDDPAESLQTNFIVRTTPDSDGKVKPSIAVGGVKDRAGNGNAAPTYTGDAEVLFDITPPAVSSVSGQSANGTYKVDQLVQIRVTFDEPVSVVVGGGTPSIMLETGTVDRPAVYSGTGGGGAAVAVFDYTVQLNDVSGDLDYKAGSLVLNGGTIKDIAGNAADLTLFAPGAAGSLSSNAALVIDGVPPTVQWSITGQTQNESTTSYAGTTVSLSKTWTRAVTVSYTESGTLSSGGVDYSHTAGVLTVPIGSTTSNTSNSFTIINDSLDEANETATLTLTSPTNATIGAQSTFDLNILDDDAPPTIQYSGSASSVTEGGGGSITLSLSAVSGQNVSVTYTVTGGTATAGGVDHNIAGGSKTITAGSTSTNITYTATQDPLYENPDETITLNISAPVNATLGGQVTHTATILNDGDAPPAVLVSAPASKAFGSVALGSVVEQTFTISNTGGQAATSLAHLTPGSPFRFKGGSFPGTPGGNCTDTSLAMGNSCDIVIEFAPTIAAGYNDDAGYDYNDGVAAQNLSINLTGTGVVATPASLSIDDVIVAPDLPFASTPFGSSDVAEFRITNDGGLTATSFGLSFVGLDNALFTLVVPFNSPDCNGLTTLAGGASCYVSVAFSPPGAGSFGDGTTKLRADYNNGSAQNLQQPLGTVSGTAQAQAVGAAYPTGGANWMDYIRRVSNTQPDYDQGSDTACNPATEIGYRSCIHGGEIRKLVVTGLASCAGVTASQAPNVLDWFCKPNAGNIELYSALKPGKGLRDFIDASGWLSMSVSIVRGGYVIAQSSNSTWWTNSFANIAGGQNLIGTGSGTIYRVTANPGPVTYVNIATDKIAVVTLSGVTWSWTTTLGSLNCIEATGAYSGSGSAACFISSPSRNFLWLEVAANQSGTGDMKHGLYLYGSRFARVHNTQLSGFKTSNAGEAISLSGTGSRSNAIINAEISNSGLGVLLNTSTDNYISKLTVTSSTLSVGNAAHGVSVVSSSTGNYFEHIRLGNNKCNGLSVAGSNSNMFFDVTSYNNGVGDTNCPAGMTEGISITSGSTGNAFVLVNSSNNRDAGILMDNPATSGNKFVGLTLLNNRWNGIYFPSAFSGSNNVFNGLVALNTSKPLEAVNPLAVQYFSNVVLGNFNAGMTLQSANPVFSKIFKTTLPGSYCGSGQSGNLGAGTCLASGVQTFTNTTISGTTTFNGGILTEDTSNASDTGGSANYGSITDWVNFMNPFRFWSRNFDPFGTVTNTGPCDGTNSACRIWDYSLRATDTVLRNISGDGATDNGTFTPGAACLSAVGPTHTVVANGETFLTNAFEEMGDFTGDNDGLCETGEKCIYMPNIGAYQGTGNPYAAAACTGTLSGVSLFAYPTN